MAEFCVDCINRINNTNYSKRSFIISKDLDLCEGCGELKRVVIARRSIYYARKMRFLVLPFWILLRLLYLPVILIKLYITKNKNNS